MASQAAQLSFRVLDNFLSHLYNSTSRLNAFKKLASYYSSKQPLERIYKLASSSEADLRGGHGGNDPPQNSERVKKNMNVLKKLIEFISNLCVFDPQ